MFPCSPARANAENLAVATHAMLLMVWICCASAPTLREAANSSLHFSEISGTRPTSLRPYDAGAVVTQSPAQHCL